MKPHDITLKVTGKAQADGVTMVYQRMAKGYGNARAACGQDLQLRAHVIPANPRTEAQMTQRYRLRAAVADWQALRPWQQMRWNQQAKTLPMTGFNLFVRTAMTGDGQPHI